MSIRVSTRQGRILFFGTGNTVKKTLLFRGFIVLALLALVMAIFWFDRDGLRDHIDGHITFTDIVYFAMVTVTTVGYGDIVPVSNSARLIDAFAVTPIRLFIWFIFLGTAYEFVIQKIVEDYRMRKLQENLQGHVVLCGFGHSGWIAAQESVAKGTLPSQIVAIDTKEDRVQLAADNGYIGLRGDAASEDLLSKACVQMSKAVIVSTGRDDTTILVVLTLRSLSSSIKIIASIRNEENIKLARQGGADTIISPPLMGGYLLANAISTNHAAPFLSDIMSMGGHMELVERVACKAEVGKTMSQITHEVIVHVYSKGLDIPFSERTSYVIQPGDTLLLITPNPPLEKAV